MWLAATQAAVASQHLPPMSVQLSAAQAVAEHFQSPDDLQKLASFRQKLEKEKSAIDAKLKSGVKDQLDITRDGLRKMFSTRANLQVIKDEMVSLDKMGRESQGQIRTFDQIAAVSALEILTSIFSQYLCPGFRCSSEFLSNRGNG